MPIVNFKFKCSLDVDTITFDGLFISIRDVIEIIKQKKKISEKNDLQLLNETTNETYTDEKVLISNGTNLLVTRIPSNKSQNKTKGKCNFNRSPVAKVDINVPLLAHVTDLSNYDTSEEEKIQAIIYQSTEMYSPIHYFNLNGLNQVGPVPPSYRCHKCYQKGHWIKDCLYSSNGCDKPRRTTGIPRSQLATVKGPQVKGALRLLDHQTNADQNKKPTNNESTETRKEEHLDISTNEVAADNFNQVFPKINYIPSSTPSQEVAKLGIVKSNLQDISILKASTLPLPTSNYSKVPCIPNGFQFINFSKPPPQNPSNFLSVNQPSSSPTDIDKMEVFLNSLRKRDEQDREKQKRQSHKYRRCSRSRSRSSVLSISSSSRYRMESPNNSTEAIQTRHHSKEHKSQARDLVTRQAREFQHRERKINRKEIMQGEQGKKFSPRRRDFYEQRKFRN